ncbi:MAG: BREX system P-loop protein BrxC, partial [Proteobacteria bacterium]|nr:BREX system P-loop protein BrxC [Pseudomonadota bacterium]
RHIDDLVAVLLATIESEAEAADKNGIWVSGFFGCGKSHLIKVLSYLLENNDHRYHGESRRAADFFKDKIGDPMLYADLKRVVSTATDTILFNIDSKADHRAGRDALLQVFLKVLNEKQGYSGDHPHIAHMERHLDERGKLGVFQEAFERAAGEPWLTERDAWEFHRDEVVTALKEALGQSEASVEKWADGGADHFALTVENFAKWVKRYLDGRGSDRRLMFLVDEVGQFIGNDTHLMLNLQTITEQLGTVCRGRAWVVVTSQEDLDAVLGDLKSAKQHDFSKIQGRFKTRLSLSSANVDEVIKKRLLDKNPSAMAPLALAYEGRHDILRNQLSFVNAGMSFKTFADRSDFSACYPFAAYQFTLVQKVFESIRKAGATGLHLSQGERSTLDAFQNAAKELGTHEVGTLVPFYRFYPAVEGFLDTAVKRTIDQASDNLALQPFDATVLKVLFLIRYIDELPGNVDNLVTLCVDEIDADRLALRKTIEASLARLESETLIARNGDLYFFLTNEERDIGREIKNTPVPSGAEERELGKLLFEDILGDERKHTYRVTGRDFSYTRLCDDHPVGHRLDGSLEVAFVSPLGDSYSEFTADERCCMHTIDQPARVLIRLPDDFVLGRELRTYLQTESYVKTKHTGSLPDTTKRILRDRSDENRARRSRIVENLKSMLPKASTFASGKKL